MSKKILLLPVNGFGIDGISQFIYCLILRSSGSDVSFDLFVNGERDSRNVLELKYDEIRNKGTNMYFSRRKSIFKYVKALKEVIKSTFSNDKNERVTPHVGHMILNVLYVKQIDSLLSDVPLRIENVVKKIA